MGSSNDIIGLNDLAVLGFATPVDVDADLDERYRPDAREQRKCHHRESRHRQHLHREISIRLPAKNSAYVQYQARINLTMSVESMTVTRGKAGSAADLFAICLGSDVGLVNIIAACDTNNSMIPFSVRQTHAGKLEPPQDVSCY